MSRRSRRRSETSSLPLDPQPGGSALELTQVNEAAANREQKRYACDCLGRVRRPDSLVYTDLPEPEPGITLWQASLATWLWAVGTDDMRLLLKQDVAEPRGALSGGI